MQRNYVIISCAALVVSVILLVYNVYAGGISFIISIALLMSFWIMDDSRMHPDIVVILKDGAKSVELKNRGNASAVNIHVAIIPHDSEFDIPLLKEEERYPYAFDKMVNEAKVVVSFENETGERFTKTYFLSATGKSEEDLLKPAFPLFKWKKDED